MDEYISREAVVRYLKGYSEKECNSNSPYGMITSSVLNKAVRALSEIPSADVQSVKRGGYWILHTEQIVDVDIKLPTECSECGFEEFSAEKYNYCPNCGTRMMKDSGVE